MIRWLLLALFIYLVIRIIRGPKRKRKPFIRFHFGNFNNRDTANGSQPSRKRKLDEIEEAEYEDITEQMNKGNKT